MNTIELRFSRYFLIFLVALSFAACGGGTSAPVDPPPPDPGGQPPPPVVPAVIADRATDHAFLTDHFSGSENCALCHDGIQDATGQDLSIVADWQPSMMAGSARDPFWRAKVASEIRRNPGLQEEIESTCSRCHAPMAHVEAGFAAADTTLLDDGFLHPDNVLFDAAAEGVSCTLCHQIADSPDLGTEAGFSGGFEVPYSFGTDRLAFGQYANPLEMPMRNQVAFTPAMSPHVSDSAVCAACHNLLTPVLDAQGSVTNQVFPEQSVYTEWEHSDFAATRSCQDCHMPVAAGDAVIARRPNNGLAPRADFARHSFVGANTYMLDILSRNRADLNITATGYNALIDETRAFLAGAISLTLSDVSRSGDELHFDVHLGNHTGHKFPTSYPSRRAWLHVTVTDATGAVIFESGAIDQRGRVEGLASDADLSAFEPHYRTIRSGDEVQSYETIMQDLGGDVTYTLLEAATYRKDNRLLPFGLDKTRVPETIRPQGNALADPDFTAGGDEVRFEIAGLAAGLYEIAVDVNYQVVAYGFVQDLAVDADDPYVAAYLALNDGAVVRYETIASATASLNF